MDSKIYLAFALDLEVVIEEQPSLLSLFIGVRSQKRVVFDAERDVLLDDRANTIYAALFLSYTAKIKSLQVKLHPVSTCVSGCNRVLGKLFQQD